MPIKIIRSIKKVPMDAKDAVVTIGNFDGMHLGHLALIEKVVKKAKSLGRKSIVITFYPHPGDFFAKKKNVVKLTQFHEKVALLENWGVDYVVFIKFNQRIASMPAPQFVEKVLHEALSVKHIILGEDFQFGYQRKGNIALLKGLSEQYGFTIDAITLSDLNGERISSTRIRKALEEGDLVLAKKMLGRPYTFTGRIQYGDALGRKLGFPTTNFGWRGPRAISGIYLVKVYGIDPLPIVGVASSGTRPTINGTKPLLEVHLLDFDNEIYGKRVTIEFIKKIRDEMTFKDLDALREHIAMDVEIAKSYFYGKKEND